MQIWLFFQAGVGGDGIANLLERSNNVVPIDGEAEYWRIHRIVDGSVKFYAPTVDNIGCFRHNQPFDQSTNQLSIGYLDIVSQNLNCIVTSHDTTLDLLANSHCKDILLKNQIKILLVSDKCQTVHIKAATKNLLPTLFSAVNSVYCSENFDYVLDVDRIQGDWKYLDNFCNEIGIDLPHAEYMQYCDLLTGNRTFMNNNFDIEEWISTIDGTHITYKLVNIWQPTQG